MIRVDNGTIEIKGTRPMVQAELIVLFKSLMENGFTESDIKESLEMSQWSDEELDKNVKKTKEVVIGELGELFKMFEEFESGCQTKNVEFSYKKK